MSWTDDEKEAIALYGIAVRDMNYVLDKIAQPTTSTLTLETLLELVVEEEHAPPGTDFELNRLLIGPIKRQLDKRRQS